MTINAIVKGWSRFKPWRLGLTAAVIVALVAATLAAIPAKKAAADTTTLTFNATQDAWVDYSSGHTNDNHGSDTTVYNTNATGAVRKSFFTFAVSGIPAGATVTGASVKLYAQNASTSTINLKTVGDTSWTEGTLTAANAPVYSTNAVANATVPAVGSVSFPVDGSVVPANNTYSFATTTSDTVNTTNWSSKEAGSNAPQLTVTYVTGDATSPLTVNASEDAYVDQTNSTTNYGSDAHLYNNNATGAAKRSFLKFNVAGIPQGYIVTSATVKVYANTGNSSVINLKAGNTNSWSQSSINWSNQPTYNATALVNSTVGTGTGHYVSFPMSGTPYVTGNGAYTFALTTSDQTTTTDWASLEAGANPPTLTVTFKAPSPLTVTPTDDAYVDQTNPATNYGSATTLVNDNTTNAVKRSWFKFKIPALPAHARVTSATVSLTAQNSPSGVTANIKSSTNTSWTQGSLTWSNAPTYNTAAISNAAPAPVVAGTETFNVTPAVTGSGTYSFVVTQSQATATNWASKESSTPPTLSINWTTEQDYGHDMIFTAAGDIACDSDTQYSQFYNNGDGTATACAQKRTATAVATSNGGGLPDRVFTLGDNQYMCGGLSAYQTAYNGSWGAFLNITSPLSGNHERNASGGTDCDATSKAVGYRTYFQNSYTPPDPDPNAGTWWSEDLPNSWHVIALDSDCSRTPDPCLTTGQQMLWLQNDLQTAATAGRKIFVLYHHPVWSEGDHGDYSLAQNNPHLKFLWDALYTYGGGKVQFVLNGHEHNSQEFSQLNQDGSPNTTNTGIAEIIAGSGGKEHLSSNLTSAAHSSLIAKDSTNFQVVRVTLHAGSYDVHWVPIAGGTTAMTDFTQSTH
jgi:hypothetical protein